MRIILPLFNWNVVLGIVSNPRAGKGYPDKNKNQE